MNLTAQEIYEKEFHVDLKGYAPAEVDEFLDMVIEDYQKYDEKVEGNTFDIDHLSSWSNITFWISVA